MTIKIAIIGTHGTLKSSLAFSLCSKLKEEDRNVELIQELVRGCPYEINGKDIRAQEWILDEYYRTEVARTSDIAGRSAADYLICDRSTLDIYVYTLNLCNKQGIKMPTWIKDKALSNMKSYDFLFKTEALRAGLKKDGTRNVNPRWQKEIATLFDKTLKKHRIRHHKLPYNSVKDIQKINKRHLTRLKTEQVEYMLAEIDP